MTPDYRAMCAELVDELEDWIFCDDEDEIADAHSLIDRVRAELAQPVAEGPSELELETIELALWDKYRTEGWGGAEFMYDTDFTYALKKYRAALARWGHPTPPVAVSEHPWERDGWCDEQGRCWWTANKPGPLPPSWWMVSIPQSCTDGIMLPAHALPTPEATND